MLHLIGISKSAKKEKFFDELRLEIIFIFRLEGITSSFRLYLLMIEDSIRSQYHIIVSNNNMIAFVIQLFYEISLVIVNFLIAI